MAGAGGEPGEACRVVELSHCPGGLVIVLCPAPLDPLSHPLAKPEKLGGVRPGSLSMGYEDDWSRAYYALVAPGGGGFYMEGGMDAFDDPGCGAEAVPLIMQWLASRTRGLDLGFIEAILAHRVFRSA